jgi:acyl carrier protein
VVALGAEIRQVLREHAALAVDVELLKPGDDLFRAGMSSHASVSVMLALEERFEIEFPDAMLTRSAFASIAAIDASVAELRRRERTA